MKKIILTIFALTLCFFYVRASEEVIVPESINEDLYAYLADIVSNTDFNNSTDYLLRSFLLSDFNPSIYENRMIDFPTFATNLIQNIVIFKNLFNQYQLSAKTNILQIRNNLQNYLQPLLESGQLSVSNLNELVDFITVIPHPITGQYVTPFSYYLYQTFFNDQPSYFGTNLFYTLDNLYLLPELRSIARASSNNIEYLSLLPQFHAMALAASNNFNIAYNNLKYHYYTPWQTYRSDIFDDRDFPHGDLNILVDFNVPWYDQALNFFGSQPGWNGSYGRYQAYMQFLNSLPGYQAYKDLYNKETFAGLAGYWDSYNTRLWDYPEKKQALLNMLDPAKIFNNPAENFFQNFNVHFGDGTTNIISIGATNIADLLTINEAVANAMIAGKLGKMADDLKKIADNSNNTNKQDEISDGVSQIAVQVSNLVAAVSGGFTYPETVISNIEEMVHREDPYETSWREFYSPERWRDVEYIRDHLEQQFKPAKDLTLTISNKLGRTSSILIPENSGLNRFMTKVKTYSQKNIVNALPGSFTVLKLDDVNAFLERYNVGFTYHIAELDFSITKEIFPGVSFALFFESIRDIFKVFYSGMGLYFSYKLTMVVMVFLTRAVQYLGIYLNIKALQLK